MKKYLSILCLFIYFTANATNYYFSNISGDDTRTSTQAQSQSTPWKSLNKLNLFFASLSPGDSVLFKRGETFYGSFTATRSGSSGSPIIIGAYGTGARPIFTSLVTLGGFTGASNIYTSATNTSLLSTVKMVLIDGVYYSMGRYPNDDATNKGYLIYETSSSAKTSITDNQLTTATNWKDADVVIRTKRWSTEIRKVLTHVGTTVTFSATVETPAPGYGYFFQNSLKTLDKNGEWYYNPATQKLAVYYSTTLSGHTVQATSIANIITITSFNYITFDNINIKGPNDYGAVLSSANTILFNNCNIDYNGIGAIKATNCNGIITQNCSSNFSHSFGVFYDLCNNSKILTDTINNVMRIPGMAPYSTNHAQGQAIYINGSYNTAQYNNITNTGYVAIYFNGNHPQVKNNFIDSFCRTKSDGGAIYGYVGAGNTTTNTATIDGNMIFHAVGAPEGGAPGDVGNIACSGIYMDVAAANDTITNNTVAGCYRGIFSHYATDLTIRNNHLYNNVTWAIDIWCRKADPTRRLVIKNNTFFGEKVTTQRILQIISDTTKLSWHGAIDSNHNAYLGTIQPFRTQTPLGSINGKLIDWQKNGFGAHDDTLTFLSNSVLKEVYAVDRDSVYSLSTYNYVNAGRTLFSNIITKTPYTSDVLLRTTISGNNPPSVILSSPSNGATYSSLGTVIINASALAQNSTITNVKFYANGTLLNTDGTAPYSYTWTNVVPGNYQITAVALASNSLTGNSLPSTITVVNTPPTVSITSPANNATFTPPASIPVNVTASDANGTIARVDVYIDNVFAGTDNSSPYSVTISSVGSGGKNISAWAVDDLGDSTKASINVSVVAANQPPTSVITLPTRDTTFRGAATINLKGTGTDADGTVTTSNFYDNGTFIHHESAQPFDYNQSFGLGVHHVTMVTKDNAGDSTTSLTLTITVLNILPVVSISTPSNDTQYVAPATVNVIGTATDDGSIVSTHLYKNNVLVGVDNTSPYTFSLTGIAAGNYSLTFTAVDNLGDSSSTTINFSATDPVYIPPDTLSINVTITAPIQCAGQSATVEVSATGVTGTVVGTGTQTKSAGVYDFIIHDDVSADTLTLTIPEPPTLTILRIDTTAIAVYGGTCQLTAQVTGGTPFYQYRLNGGNYVTSSVFTVPAGTHTIDVIDQHGCTTSSSVTVHQPSPAGNTYQVHPHKHKNISL